jgi:hypothetical protein
LTQHELRDLAVISFAEIPDSVEVDLLAMIPMPNTTQAANSGGEQRS